jgi:hypothetical protein
VWESTIDGRKLTFHLAGINNQNFIMRDEETGSWWQQVSGEAIQGPLKGRRLNLVFHDEISFSTWRKEKPEGRVLRPDEKAASLYEEKNWEEGVARAPVVTPSSPDDPLKPRELVIGIRADNEAKAYPLRELQKQAALLDTLGATPLLIVLDADKKSARAFDRTVDGRVLEFFAKADANPLRLIDAETGSDWDFSGKAISGALKDRQLKKIYVLSDYWFDWKIYNPNTAVYSANPGKKP